MPFKFWSQDYSGEHLNKRLKTANLSNFLEKSGVYRFGSQLEKAENEPRELPTVCPSHPFLPSLFTDLLHPYLAMVPTYSPEAS